MDKYLSLIIIFFFNSICIVNGQTLLDKDQLVTYNEIPQEKIFIHYNNSLLFSGDYLYYRVYCINSQTNKLSEISKIAYVELIGEDKNPVFKHKINLKNGLGQSDFFIPTSTLSGNYKLIAYTKWMRNIEEDYFFQGDISIINPFIKTKNSAKQNTSDSISNQSSFVNTNSTNTYINLTLDSKRLSKREKVVLTISPLLDKASYGNYSISVNKIDSIKTPNKPTSNTYNSIYQNTTKDKSISIGKTIYLPELRGELISGKVLKSDTKKAAPYKKISLSITGENSIFKSSITNSFGIFYFNLDKPYNALNANLQVMEDDRESYTVVLYDEPSINYDNLVFNDFSISPKMEKLIIDRSINNQIENAYSSVKQHKSKKKNQVKPFYQGEAIYYNLDDYARFSTIKETVVEIIKEVYTEKRKGINNFKIRSDEPTDKSLLTLIIVDGLPILNHDDLFFYDARKIKTISVINKRYKYGGDMFSGIISVETIEGDFKNNISNNYFSKNITLFKPENDKEYFKQTYNDVESKNRIPDFRNQLLWMPNFVLDQKEKIITFFTSDYTGNYEISIEGFTKDGVPISLKEEIIVD